MARKFLTSIDLTGQELQNALIQNLGAAPGTPSKGRIYFDTTLNQLRVYDGTAWQVAELLFGTGASTASAVGDTAADGTATTSARADHKHAREAFGAPTAQLSFGLAAANGTALTEARSDHTHGTPADPTGKPLGLTGAAAATRYVGGTASGAPTTGTFAVGDFVIDQTGAVWICTALGTPGTWVKVGATILGGGTPSTVTFGAANDGVSTAAAREDHTHAVTAPAAASGSAVGDAAAAGTSANVARADHVHGREGFAAPTAQTTFGAASVAGTATTHVRSDHTHGTPAMPSADQLAAQAADYSANTHKITNVVDPVNPQDAATKAYVDARAAGLDPKAAAVAATTAALPANTYNNGTAGVGATLTGNANGALPAIDGYAPAVGDRILVKNEAAAANNGIYTVSALGSGSAAYVLTRVTDFNTGGANGNVVPGAFVFVESGTNNANGGFILSGTGTWTIGTTAVSWVQFTGAGEIIAGTGLTKTGNTIGMTVAPLAKFTATIGDGSATSIAVTDGLGTIDKMAIIRDATTNAMVECDITYSAAQTTFAFAVAPALNSFKVVVIG